MGAHFTHLLAEVKANRCSEVELNADFKTAELLQMIKALHSNTSVEELILAQYKIAKPDVTTALVTMLPANRSIKYLNLSNIGDEAFARSFAVGLERHTVLEGLCLMNCSFSNVGFQAIFAALERCPNLSKLELFCSPITDGAVTALSRLLQSTLRLTELNLNCCNLAPSFLMALLTVLAKTSSLRTLSLRANSLDEACATALCGVLRSHTALTSLTVALKPGALPLTLNTLVQRRSLRCLFLDLFDEDAKHIPSLLRAESGLMELELRFRPLSGSQTDAIVEALRSNHSLLKFSLPGQQLLLANSLAIESVLQQNEDAAAIAATLALEAVPGRAQLHSVASAAAAAGAPPPAHRASPPKAAAAFAGAGAPNVPAAAAARFSRPASALGSARTAASIKPSPFKGPPTAATISPEELQDLVQSLRDMQCQLAQLRFAVNSQAVSTAPLRADHNRRQAVLSTLRVIQANQTARDYHEHVRLLLTCAHVGAAAICSGNVEGRGSGAATAGVLAVEQLPKLIAKGLGAAAESIPLVGAGGAALTALIKAADESKLNVRMQRVVQLAHTPGELTALVDCLARRLTLLQWGTVSSPAALVVLVKGSGFRGWIKQLLGPIAAEALYIVKGAQKLNAAQKAALADVERFLKFVAVKQLGFSFECPPHVAGGEARAEELTLRAVKLLLPNRASYDEQLPLNAAAASAMPFKPAATTAPSLRSAGASAGADTGLCERRGGHVILNAPSNRSAADAVRRRSVAPSNKAWSPAVVPAPAGPLSTRMRGLLQCRWLPFRRVPLADSVNESAQHAVQPVKFRTTKGSLRGQREDQRQAPARWDRRSTANQGRTDHKAGKAAAVTRMWSSA